MGGKQLGAPATPGAIGLGIGRDHHDRKIVLTVAGERSVVPLEGEQPTSTMNRPPGRRTRRTSRKTGSGSRKWTSNGTADDSVERRVGEGQVDRVGRDDLDPLGTLLVIAAVFGVDVVAGTIVPGLPTFARHIGAP